MSDSEVTIPGNVENIAAKVAQLRNQIVPLRRRAGNAYSDLGYWLDDADASAALSEIEYVEKQIADIGAQILELAHLVTEPHPLWPGGWLIEAIDQNDPALRWMSPSRRSDAESSTPGAPLAAWRTRAAAEAEVPTEDPERYRVVWSPIGRSPFSESPDTPLDGASLDAIGDRRSHCEAM